MDGWWTLLLAAPLAEFHDFRTVLIMGRCVCSNRHSSSLWITVVFPYSIDFRRLQISPFSVIFLLLSLCMCSCGGTEGGERILFHDFQKKIKSTWNDRTKLHCSSRNGILWAYHSFLSLQWMHRKWAEYCVGQDDGRRYSVHYPGCVRIEDHGDCLGFRFAGGCSAVSSILEKQSRVVIQPSQLSEIRIWKQI